MRLCLKEMIPIAKKRKNGEGTLRLRKDGRWEGRIVVGYNEKSLPITKCVTAKTKTECSTKLEALKEQYGRSSDRIKADMPFGDWIDFWYQTYCRHTLRITTRTDYENRIYNHIIPEIGKIPLNRLSQSDLQQFYAKEKTDGRKLHAKTYGKGLSDRTIRGIHANCRTALQRAVQEGLIRTNPAVGCKLPPKKAREMQVLTQNEILRFLHQAKEEGYYELFLLELGTGMRRGEILALKWSDLNFKTGELHIERQVYIIKAEVIISEPKTKASIRTVILPPSLLKTLVAYKETVDSEWMFPSPTDNGRPRNPSSVRKRLQLILERAGCKKVRFHDLRHPYVKHTTKIFSLRLMDFQAQAYPDARRKTRGACQLLRVGQSRSPVRPLCNRKRFSCLPPQSKMSWILYAISMRLSGYTSTRSISSSASSVVSVSASKIALDASLRLSCRACSSCFFFACANTAA